MKNLIHRTIHRTTLLVTICALGLGLSACSFSWHAGTGADSTGSTSSNLSGNTASGNPTDGSGAAANDDAAGVCAAANELNALDDNETKTIGDVVTKAHAMLDIYHKTTPPADIATAWKGITVVAQAYVDALDEAVTQTDTQQIQQATADASQTFTTDSADLKTQLSTYIQQHCS